MGFVSFPICIRKLFSNEIIFTVLLALLCYMGVFAQRTDVNADSLFDLGTSFYNATNYDSAIFFLKQASDKYFTHKDNQGYFKSSIKIADSYRQMGKFDTALNYLSALAKSPDFDLSDTNDYIIDFYFVKGSSHGDKGQYKLAEELISKFIDLRSQRHSFFDTLVAYGYNNLGSYSYFMGDYEKSIESFRKALEITEYNSDSELNPDIAMYSMNIGIILASTNKLEEANKYFQRALNINKQLLDELDPALAILHLNLGRNEMLQSHYESALEHYKLAESIYINVFGEDYHVLGTLYLNMGNIFNNKQDFEKALEYYKKAYQLLMSIMEKSHPVISKALNNMGSIYFNQKKYKNALDHYELSLEMTNDPISKTIILRNLGKIYNELDDFDLASKYFLNSVDYAKDNLEDNHYETAKSFLALGEYLQSREMIDSSLAIYYHAYYLFFKNFGFNNPFVAEVLTKIGDLYYDLGKYQKALRNYQQAIIASSEKFSDTNIANNPSLKNVLFENEQLAPLYGKSKTLNALFKRTEDVELLKISYECNKLIIDILDRLRSHIREESKFAMAEKNRDIFNNAMHTVFDLYEQTGKLFYLSEAFKLSEKSKYNVLLSAIRDVEAKELGGIPDSLIFNEKELKRDIRNYEKLIFDEKQKITQDSKSIIALESKLFELNKEYDNLICFFEKDFPEYYDLKYNTKVAEPEKIGNLLNKNTAIVEYSLFDSVIYTFVITDDEISGTRISLTKDDYKMIEDLIYYYQFSLYDHSKKVYEGFLNSSHGLYKLLLEPFNEVIADKNIIVVPDGILGHIPFETMITSLDSISKIEYRNLPYLMKEHSLSYAYTATILTNNSVRKQRNSNLIAFSPMYYGDMRDLQENRNDNDTITLFPLLFSEYEVDKLGELFDGFVLKNREATISNFKKYAKDYGIVHLAMHTIIEDNNPMYSKLVFTKSDSSNGYLHAYELYNSEISAQLVVLSACNTGIGLLRRGEGIVNLARGFVYSGVPSIVMTLWEVDDKSGSEIMAGFYTYLKDGKSKNEALRLAKLDYLKSVPQFRAHPYFWSAYIIMGEIDPITSNSWSFISLIIYTLSALFLGFLIWRIAVYKRN